MQGTHKLVDTAAILETSNVLHIERNSRFFFGSSEFCNARDTFLVGNKASI